MAPGGQGFIRLALWTQNALGLIEWYAGGKRRREFRGHYRHARVRCATPQKHELEGHKLGVPVSSRLAKLPKKPPLHVAVSKYLEQVETLKKTQHAPQI